MDDVLSFDHWEPAYQLSLNLMREVKGLEPQGKRFIHYTTLEAFYSIIDSSRLRFTSVKSTNDPSEFLFGREIVEKGLKAELDLCEEGHKDLIGQCIRGLDHQNFKAFVFCMSEAVGDESDVGELSQWRLYGGDGRGIALVFDVEPQGELDRLQALTSIPRRVVYGEDEGVKIVRDEVRAFLDGLKTLPGKTIDFLEKTPTTKAGYLGNTVFWLPSVIKHDAYVHEREIRLIRGDIGEHAGNPLVFYEKGNIQRPAIELPISRMPDPPEQQIHNSPLKKVIIGPSGDQAAIEDSIKYYLEARKWNISVGRSDIPYRAI